MLIAFRMALFEPRMAGINKRFLLMNTRRWSLADQKTDL
jgi:hypothetical protein